MIEIHEAFRKKEFRFCPITKHSKKGFSDHNKLNYEYNNAILNSYLKNDYNYGILVGYGFDMVIDVDNEHTHQAIEHLLPPTLQQVSGIKRLPQLFYKAPYFKQSKMFKGHIDFLAKGRYVMGCNSIVKNEKVPEDTKLYKYGLKKIAFITQLPEESFNKIIKIIEPIYISSKPTTKKEPNKINPDINWFNQEDSKRYFNNPEIITGIKKLYKKDKQYIFEAYFPDVDKRISFGLNKPTENKMIDILINGRDKAKFYTKLYKGNYMRQIENV